jgi:energy-coupling factor transporter transmembrane protein EcfT
MRKLFLVLAIIFTALSIVFAYLPLGTLALIPIGIAILFGILALKKSDIKQQKVVKVILLFAILSLVFVVGKEIFTKDEVVIDKQFDTKKVESKKEAKKDLEELDGL